MHTLHYNTHWHSVYISLIRAWNALSPRITYACVVVIDVHRFERGWDESSHSSISVLYSTVYLGGNIYLASSCIAATCGLASCTHVHMLAYTPRHGLPSRSFTRIVALATPCCDTLRTYYHRLGFVGPFVPIHTNPWTPTTYIYIYIYIYI